MRAYCVEKLAYFVSTTSSRSCFHNCYNCDFDNNFVAISNDFLDTTQFGNPTLKVTR